MDTRIETTLPSLLQSGMAMCLHPGQEGKSRPPHAIPERGPYREAEHSLPLDPSLEM